MVIYFPRKNFRPLILKGIATFILFLFLFPGPISAKNFKIESEDVKRIDLALDLVKTWGNLVLPDEFKRVLNTTITGTEAGTDITYGLLVLSAVNEMEMIDRVISQRYKLEATEYFNTILDQQISLIGYYKGLGFDISRILIAKNIGGPISALTLNTFDMTNKVIVALVAIENIKKVNFYDGLWRYFEQRRTGNSHQESWEFAAYEMGSEPISNRYSPKKSSKQNEIQLQFADLWNKWEKSTDAFGVKREIKQQFKEEMQGVVQQAAEAYIVANAAQKTEVGFAQAISKRVAEFGQKIQQGIAWATEKTKTFVGKISSFLSFLSPSNTGAGVSITILNDGTVIEEQPLGKKSTIVANLPDDNTQKTQPAEGILNLVKDDKDEQPEQRNPQILVPRMLAQEREKQEREKAKNAENLDSLSFERCKNGQININAANAVLLNELTGIGPVKAQSIIGFRSQKAFYKVDDLTKISGIGEATLSKIKDQGLACAASANDTSFTSFKKTTAAQSSETPSSASGGSAGTPTYLKILITEVQTAGTSSQTDEFIELYNPNDSKVELHDWYLQKKTQSATDFSSFVSKTLFEGEQIAAHGYFLIARQGSSLEGSADTVTTSSLADNNVLALKNPNGEISDKVGWGNVLDYEGSPALNPAAGKSLARKYSSSYQDTNNNSQDFEEKDPTPKAVNQSSSSSSENSSSASTDTTLPEVVFDSLSTTQTTAFFNLGWTGSDAQGIDNYFAQYTVSPSADGIFLQYFTTGTWQNWQTGNAGEITLDSTVNSVSLTAQDGIEYMFSLTAKDAAGNESSTASATTNVSLEKNVVINEIAWAGTKADPFDEWIELYNNIGSSIDLTGWKLQSSDADGPDIELVGSIGANSFYLIERTDDNPTSETADAKESFGNGLSNDTCEVLYLYDSLDNIVDQTFCNSNGTWPGGEGIPNYISLERIDSQTSGAKATNWATNNLITFNGKDYLANNWINGTPKNTNSVSLSETELTNLRFNEFSTLTLTLLGQPYYSNGQVTIPSGNTLIMEPGVTVKLKGGAAKLEVSGTLSAVGTSANQIVFTTYKPPGASNIWCGIHFTSTSQDSNLQYVTVEKASSMTSGCGTTTHYAIFVENSDITLGNSTVSGGDSQRKLYLKNSNSVIDALTASGVLGDTNLTIIYIDGGSPTIKNSTLSTSAVGIWNTNSSGAPTISDNTFTNNIYPIKLTGGSGTVSGSSASENTYDAILVEGSASTNITWQADNIPYLIDSFIVSTGKTLTIQAGTTIKFASLVSGSRQLTVNGNIVTQGTVGQLVTFSPWTPGGNWKQILLESGSTADLQYTKLEYGGNTFGQGALHVKEATVEISNVEIKNSANNAIYGFNATISGSNLTLTDNATGFLIQTGDCPSITGVTKTGGDWGSCTFQTK